MKKSWKQRLTITIFTIFTIFFYYSDAFNEFFIQFVFVWKNRENKGWQLQYSQFSRFFFIILTRLMIFLFNCFCMKKSWKQRLTRTFWRFIFIFFRYKATILLLTFMSYTTFHLSRKVISVVKPVLIECDNVTDTCTSWIDEINGKMTYRAKRMEGTMDSAFLFSYAAFMFASGFVAERMNLRYFLSIGMIISGVLTFLLGFAKVVEIHSIYYFIIVQVRFFIANYPPSLGRNVFDITFLGFCWCLSVFRLAWSCHRSG